MAVIVGISLLISCLRMNTEHIFSLRTYADPVRAAPCSEQMAKAVYTAGYQAGQNTFSSVPGIPYGCGSFLFYADWGIMGIF